jgi:hypothetical protein
LVFISEWKVAGTISQRLPGLSLSGHAISSKESTMPKKKPKPRTGRAPKRAGERKSRYVTLSLGKARLDLYIRAAAKGFKGNLAAFLRAAADDLAARLGATEKQLKRERDAFRSAVADSPEQFERDKS